MTIVDLLNAALDVPQHALGDIRADAGAGHEAAGGSAQVVDHPAGHAARSVEPRFVLRVAVGVALSAAGEYVWVALKDRQRGEEIARRLRQLELTAVRLFSFGDVRDAPYPVRVDVCPRHGQHLVELLRGQEQHADEGAIVSQRLAGSPDPADFVIVEHPDPGLRMRRLATHAADDRRGVVVAPGGVPVHDRPRNGQDVIGRSRPILVLDPIKQGGDVAASDRDQFAGAPSRQDMDIEQPVDFPGGAQAIAFEMPRSPLGGYISEGLGLG